VQSFAFSLMTADLYVAINCNCKHDGTCLLDKPLSMFYKLFMLKRGTARSECCCTRSWYDPFFMACEWFHCHELASYWQVCSMQEMSVGFENPCLPVCQHANTLSNLDKVYMKVLVGQISNK